jgi:hypothetical protein
MTDLNQCFSFAIPFHAEPCIHFSKEETAIRGVLIANASWDHCRKENMVHISKPCHWSRPKSSQAQSFYDARILGFYLESSFLFRTVLILKILFPILGSRIHGIYPPAHWVAGYTAPIRRPVGQQDTQHLSAGPLGSRMHGTYPAARWAAGYTAPIRRPIG